ncbi:expressed unknown protein [Seminavis robusta]|uniref:Peptidase M11 gametolysin domain-containing protein n=1 Tax=Seminavis robusta TaxID=568900 RepID=A0A9N8H8V7_9STRA|nr:expressed unknown protein [Seminavis robusta]|eukprot:Sro183_g079630.1 n/a (1014) ;mRNA; f:32528-35569
MKLRSQAFVSMGAMTMGLLLLYPRSSNATLLRHPEPSLRGQAVAWGLRRHLQESEPSSVLCHVMKLRVDFLESTTESNNWTDVQPALEDTDDDQEDIVCETTLPNDNGNNGNSNSSTALWMYKMNNLPQSIRNQLFLDSDDSQPNDWIHISHVLRDESTATLDILPNATITIGRRPSNIISLGDATVNSVHHRRRSLTQTYQNMGYSKVLVVRVTYLGFAPTVTADDLSGRIFGIGPQAKRDVNLRRQIKECSFDKLILGPAPPIRPRDRSSNSSAIVRGVTEMNITEAVAHNDDSVRTLENKVVLKLRDWYGPDFLARTNHIVIVFPNSNLIRFRGRNYLAYAYLRGKYSIFNNDWGTSLSALAHELGHNWNLNHAGESGQAYGDLTGMLGFGVKTGDYPRSCFNAQKNWFLRWYEDRSRALVVEPSPTDSSATSTLPWTGDMVAFVDYSAAHVAQPVVLQISSDNSQKRLYCQFNRAKKFNRETREYPNQVVIIEEEGSLASSNGIQSWVAGTIQPPSIRKRAEPGEYTFSYGNFASGGRAVHFQVCLQVRGPNLDFVRLSIYLDGQTSGCEDDSYQVGDPYPTVSPTLSMSPSVMPSVSVAPSWAPSGAPVVSETPTAFCEDFDDENWQYFDESLHTRPSLVNCVWLKRQRDRLRNNLCSDPTSQAATFCPDTCGECFDGCDDDLSEPFFVSHSLGNRTCQWLWQQPKWQDRLCMDAHPANTICAETCNSCPPVNSASPVPSASPSESSIPSESPSGAPTGVPTPSPSTAPSSFCEDSPRKFKLTPNSTSYINCAWLTRHPDKVAENQLCNPENTASTAHSMCPDTCNLCYDNCSDDERYSFYVDESWEYRHCLWLSTRPHYISRLCVDGHPANDLCADTCNRCPQGRPSCEDSRPGTFFWIDGDNLRNRRKRDCVWLARRDAQVRESLCQLPADITDTTTAYHVCPETCGFCSDSCEDDPGITFYVNANQGNRTCDWLSTRPFWQNRTCVQGSTAWEHCRESCNSCDSY